MCWLLNSTGSFTLSPSHTTLTPFPADTDIAPVHTPSDLHQMILERDPHLCSQVSLKSWVLAPVALTLQRYSLTPGPSPLSQKTARSLLVSTLHLLSRYTCYHFSGKTDTQKRNSSNSWHLTSPGPCISAPVFWFPSVIQGALSSSYLGWHLHLCILSPLLQPPQHSLLCSHLSHFHASETVSSYSVCGLIPFLVQLGIIQFRSCIIFRYENVNALGPKVWAILS